MTRLLVALLLAPAAAVAQDTYPQSGLEHVAGKAVYAFAAYEGLRELHASKPVSVLISTLGVTLAGKGIERLRGRRPGLRDAVHDLAWSGLLVVPVAIGGRRGVLGFGLLTVGIFGTCSWSDPRWC